MKLRRKTYYGGALRFPVTVTQKFWDEVTRRRREINKNNVEAAGRPIIDTTYGSDDLGERPEIADWVYDAAYFVFGLISLSCLVFMIYVFKRGY